MVPVPPRCRLPAQLIDHRFAVLFGLDCEQKITQVHASLHTGRVNSHHVDLVGIGLSVCRTQGIVVILGATVYRSSSSWCEGIRRRKVDYCRSVFSLEQFGEHCVRQVCLRVDVHVDVIQNIFYRILNHLLVLQHAHVVHQNADVFLDAVDQGLESFDIVLSVQNTEVEDQRLGFRVRVLSLDLLGNLVKLFLVARDKEDVEARFGELEAVLPAQAVTCAGHQSPATSVPALQVFPRHHEVLQET